MLLALLAVVLLVVLLSSLDRLALFLTSRSVDSASLGVFRAAFGALMLCDLVAERGFLAVRTRWSDAESCQFPLFAFRDDQFRDNEFHGGGHVVGPLVSGKKVCS